MKLFHNDVAVVKEEGPDLEELDLGDELCSDSFPYKIYEDVWYKFTLATRTDKDDGDYNTGANASQEEAADSLEVSAKSGINAVLNSKLEVNQTIVKKKDLKDYIKTYYPALKKVTAKKHPDLSPEALEERNKKVQLVFKKFLEDFENCEFYSGENHNLNGTHLFIMWDGETPYGYLPIDGVKEVKY